MLSVVHLVRRWLSTVRRRPEPVELDLVQQLALRTLARFGPQPYARLAAEISAVRRATPAEITAGLLKLESAGVIEREQAPAGRRYALTRRGRRFLPYIPEQPRSVLQFYI